VIFPLPERDAWTGTKERKEAKREIPKIADFMI
jgi:hypothetical protein